MRKNSGPLATFEQVADVDKTKANENENVNNDANNNVAVVADQNESVAENNNADVNENANANSDYNIVVNPVEPGNEDVIVNANSTINIDDYVTVADPKYMIGIYFDKSVAKVLRKLTRGKKGAQSRLVNDAVKKLFQDNGYL